MENHPIPQDITGFKFKLIGNITVKQFLYLLITGVVIYLIFVTNLYFLIKYPLILLIGLFGLALAFLPVDGRPLDKMVINFLLALPRENRYFYDKKAEQANLQSPLTEEQSKAPDLSQESAIAPISSPSLAPQADNSQAPEVNLPPDGGFNKSADKAFSVTPPSPIRPIFAPEENSIKKAEIKTALLYQPSALTKPAEQNFPEERTLLQKEENGSQPNQILATAGIELSDTPNIVLGIVRDARGKVLGNMIVEINDQSGNPVRAFKTTTLGQFAAATPLLNGKYIVTVTDTQKLHEFRPVEVNLTGNIFKPIEIVSIDAREKLRRELFGK